MLSETKEEGKSRRDPKFVSGERLRGTVVDTRNSKITEDHRSKARKRTGVEYSHGSERGRLIFRTRVIRRRP